MKRFLPPSTCKLITQSKERGKVSEDIGEPTLSCGGRSKVAWVIYLYPVKNSWIFRKNSVAVSVGWEKLLKHLDMGGCQMRL
tara:strand:- start:569 stop:814 length:246 start_codon:yes stop_codon:yes gene_type:complete